MHAGASHCSPDDAAVTRIAMGISYAGTRYQGWQRQPSGNTVQDKLEQALQRFSQQPLQTRCAGRTDARVHALMQVVHFDTDVQRRAFSWVRGTNHFLPDDIAVQWAREVPAAFHARGSASARRYAYVLLQSPVRPSVEAGRVGWVFRPLDAEAMRTAAGFLLGRHDFSSFRASGCQAHTPIRTLVAADIRRRGAYWRFEFEADGFLYHMIRNIMGGLLFVGQGARPPEWMRDVLQACDRRVAAPTFAGDGLYFCGPRYPAHWGLPQQPLAYDWLP